MGSHTNSAECGSLINQWLSNCTSNHTACAQNSSRLVCPTRVIDVATLQLVESSSLSASNRRSFATLSHSWGTTPMSAMTMKRYASYIHGVDKNCMPKNFQDAISVAKRLNIPYLWIDALCIIQDSMEDWAVEASRMGSYYRDCIPNISALDASDSNADFLNRRPPHPVAHLQDELFLRRSQPTWQEVFLKSPLSQRAWVLQERLVSTRVLHFGEAELFWECSTVSERESSSQQHGRQDQDTEWGDENFKRSLQFSSNDPDHVMKSWCRVVAQYSTLQITFPGDILPAISGLANIFAQATGFTYVAGLWTEHIHSGLIWYRTHLGRRGLAGYRADSSWRAPSWSWASLEGPVHNLFGVGTTHLNTPLAATIVEANSRLASQNNPFGRIVEASLVLDAFCTEVWCKSARATRPFNDPYLGLILDIYSSRGIMIGTGYRDFLCQTQKGDLEHCLAVAISKRSSPESAPSDPDYDPVTVAFSLLVTLIPGSEPQSYARIGVGQTADSHSGTVFEKDPFPDTARRIRLL